MPFTEQVVLEFLPETSGLEQAAEMLLKLGQIDQETYDTFKRNNAAFAARQQSLETYAALQEKVGDKTKQAEKNFESLSKAAKGLSDNLLNEGASKFLDKLNSQIKITEQEMTDFEQGAVEGVKEALNEAGVSADEFRDALLKLDNGAKSAEGGQKSLKSQLKELKLAMAELKLAGRDNTAEYELLRSKAGEVTGAIGDVNQEVARAGSGTSGIDKAISATTALVGGFQIAQGAAALLGGDNDKLQETFVRLQAGMSLLQGIQAVGNELAREDSLIKKGLAVANTITAATQRALGIATVETSVGFKILRTAIISTGIGALIVAIGLLISNWDTVKAKMIEVKEKVEDLYDRFALLRVIIITSIGPIVALYQGLKWVGEAIGLLDDKKTQQLKTGLEESAKAAESLKERLSGQADMLEAMGGKSQRILDLRKESLLTEELMLKKQLELARANEDEEKMAELTNSLHKNKIDQLKLEDEVMKFQVQKMKDQGASEKEILAFQKQRIAARINELEVILKQAEAMKLLEGGLFDILRDGFVSAANAEIEALRNKMDIVQTDFENKTKEAVKKTNAKVKQEKMKIEVPAEPAFDKEGFMKALKALNDDYKSRIPPLEVDLPLDNSILDKYDKLAVLATNRQEQSRKDLDNSYKMGLISTQEYWDAIYALGVKEAQKEIALQEKKQKQINDLKRAAMQIGNEIASTLINNAKENNQEDLQSKLDSIATEKAALEDLHNSKKINDADYAKQKKIMERNESDAKRRAWERDRQIAQYEVGIKTIQAVITAFASSGPPANFLLAAAAGAFGLAQEAALAAKKPPKFAVGTKSAPPGWKWVGEEGPELINTPGGEEIKTHRDSLAFAANYKPIWDKMGGISSMMVDNNGVLKYNTNDPEKIEKAVYSGMKRALKDTPLENHTFDRRGYSLSIREGDKIIYDLGAKF